ncbi:hypothetical protein GG344DRAFT_81559 [Lentinula edodes]|nr:hypothetical protein GG344DRAFT_81559 [Lentinula edodes]
MANYWGFERERPLKEGDPEYWNVYAPLQYPSEDQLPGFKALFKSYLAQVSAPTSDFLRLVSEALGLPPDTSDQFYQTDDCIWNSLLLGLWQHNEVLDCLPAYLSLPISLQTLSAFSSATCVTQPLHYLLALETPFSTNFTTSVKPVFSAKSSKAADSTVQRWTALSS